MLYFQNKLTVFRDPWPFISTMQMPGKQDLNHVPQYPDKIASVSVLGLRLHYISLAGPQYSRFLYNQVSFWNRAIGLMYVAASPASGLQRWGKLAGAQMFKDRMTVPETIIDQSFPQIKAIFTVLADPSSYPVLVLNKYGNDFVSLVVDLVLLLLDTDTQSMYQDYMQIYEDLAGLKEERLEANRKHGIPEDYVEPYLPFVSSLERLIQIKHGGIEQYLLSVGLSMSELQAVRKNLESDSSLSEKHRWLVDV
jgi:protein-tyrosine phosphatase